MFKYIIFDLDNTIYDYNLSHETAIEKTLWTISQDFNFNMTELKTNYQQEKQKYQNYCYQQAACHNKFIQIKKLFEKKKLEFSKLEYYYQIYTETFEQSLSIFPGVIEFIKFCNSNNIKMYILTNNICQEQIQRLTKMNLIHYFEKIYTSEEFGLEKPDMKLFSYLLYDIGCSSDEIVKIGDNFKNDIEPLIMNNIYSFWFCKNKLNIFSKYLEFNNFNELLVLFQNYYVMSDNFVDISHYVGERFDLVQAGGGNTSFKLNNLLFVKSSGCHLCTIDRNKNYIGVNYPNIRKNLKNINSTDKKIREQDCKQLVSENIIFLKKNRPSIETTLHCLTDIYTVHIHPIQFNYISSLKNCDTILKQLFTDYCLIDYETPGIDVSLKLIEKYQQEKIIFLKNHGLVITANKKFELKIILDNIITKLEDYLYLNNQYYFKKINVSFLKYHLVNDISQILRRIVNEKKISYLSQNEIINKFINEENLELSFRSFFPDKIVYCGINYIMIDNAVTDQDNIEKKIIQYITKYDECPKIFIIKDNKNLLYISSNSINKCREIEEVLVSHLICYNDNNQFLSESETNYLNNWDAEKYRKSLI